MQFNFNHKISQDVVNVEFITPQKADVWYSLSDSFERIGGKPLKLLKDWTFPSFISSQVIQEIIHNTCFVCGGLMKDSTAYDNTWVSFDDFGGDAGQIGTTMSKSGTAKLLKVRKCTQCGHSHT